jgi:bacterioferritin (cytochrome b1)
MPSYSKGLSQLDDALKTELHPLMKYVLHPLAYSEVNKQKLFITAPFLILFVIYKQLVYVIQV